MPELSVTEEQLERLEALRAELEAAFVDGYAHVRRRDAVDYLLDTYTPPAERTGEGGDAGARDGRAVEERVRAALDREVRDDEGEIDYPALQSVARETDGVKGSGMGAEEMYEAVVEAKVSETEAGGTDGVEISETDAGDRDGTAGSDAEDAGGEDAGGVDDRNAEDAGVDDAEAPSDGDTAAPAAEPAGSGPSEAAGDDGGNGDGDGDDGTASASAAGGSQLQAMMNLLETHDDKWRKTESGDAPYEVDLPDGGTEAVRTKDDVKRVLFTNY